MDGARGESEKWGDAQVKMDAMDELGSKMVETGLLGRVGGGMGMGSFGATVLGRFGGGDGDRTDQMDRTDRMWEGTGER